MKLLFLACVLLVIGSVASKGLLPTIPINEHLEKLLPNKFLQPLRDLNQHFQDFNDKVDLIKMTPALAKGGSAGLSLINLIGKLATVFATGQYVNPLAIGGMAQQALTTSAKVQEAMQSVRDIPVEIPGDKGITFVLNNMNKVLNVLKCLQPLNCIHFG